MKNEKKLMLCGAIAAEKNNFGDFLMTDILIKNIRKTLGDVKLVYTKVDGKKACKLKDYIDSDAFIYIPGGYLGYIEKFYSGTYRKTKQRLLYYYLPALIMIFLRKPIYIVGQGVGPYEYFVLHKILKFIFNHASLVTVRDIESRDFILSIGVKKKIYITSDTAQTCINYNYIHEIQETKMIERKFSDKKKIIFVFYAGFPEWKTKIVEALNMGIMQDDDVGFVIGSDNIVNKEDFRKFANLFPKDRTFRFNYKNHEQLLSIFNKVDVILTCKLHTGITGCTLSKSVICLSVQYEKAICYYKQIGETSRVADLNKITSEKIYELIIEHYNRKVILSDEIRERANKNYDYLNKHLKNKIGVY